MRSVIPALMGLTGLVCTSVLALGVVNYEPSEGGLPLWRDVPITGTDGAVLAEANESEEVSEASDGELTIETDATTADGSDIAASVSVDRHAADDAKGKVNHPVAPITHRRVYRVTAYCDQGLTASGTRVGRGQCAAPVDIPFGSKIYIPALGRSFVVTDRTSYRFRRNTVDIYIPSEAQCWRFGLNHLECLVSPSSNGARRLAGR